MRAHTRSTASSACGMLSLLLAFATGTAACHTSPAPPVERPRLGQWIWTRTDIARFHESATVRPGLQAGVFIGSVHCDPVAQQLVPRVGLAASDPHIDSVTVVIRFEDGLDRCRTSHDETQRFDMSLDSAVRVLRTRAGHANVSAVQLDCDAPQRTIAAWAGSVRYLHQHALTGDAVWVTSLIAQLREPAYGDLFRDAVVGHVLQVFDTGEPASATQIREALRLARRAHMSFRLGLGAFERDTKAGPTDHRAWFALVSQFAVIDGYRGVWVFPAGQRWTTFLGAMG